jgi:hypothetical protein
MMHRIFIGLCLLLAPTAACTDGPWPDTVTDAVTYLEDESEECGATAGTDTDTTTGGSCMVEAAAEQPTNDRPRGERR